MPFLKGQSTEALTSKHEFEGSKSLQVEAGDFVFAKLKHDVDNDDTDDDYAEYYWSWHKARVDAIHSGDDIDQSISYDVTYQYNGEISKSLSYKDVLSLDSEQYWKSYFGVTRQSGIVANFHYVGQMILSGLKFDENTQAAVIVFAEAFFSKLHATSFIGTSCLVVM